MSCNIKIDECKIMNKKTTLDNEQIIPKSVPLTIK